MKQIEGYYVTDAGNVFSSKADKLKQLKPWTNRGYLCVDLTVNGKRKTAKVHRLVAEAFIPNPENKRCVNHKDGNKTNNHISNLEWCTHKENHTHSIKLGMTTNLLRSSKPVRQYTLDGELVAEFVSTKEASKITGINQRNISSVCLGTHNRKTTGNFIWRYFGQTAEIAPTTGGY